MPLKTDSARFADGGVLEWNTSKEKIVPVGDDVGLPARLTYRHDGLPPQPALVVEIEVTENGTPVCTSVQLTGAAVSSPVRVRDLRAVPLEQILDRAMGMAVYERTGPTSWRKTWGVDMSADQRRGTAAIRAAQREARRKITPELLAEVAAKHREIDGAKITGIADLYGISPRTASRYIRAAREGGYLEGDE
jgi:hypothetical protein